MSVVGREVAGQGNRVGRFECAPPSINQLNPSDAFFCVEGLKRLNPMHPWVCEKRLW